MLPVSAAGHIAGHLTRCVYSPRLEHNIALVNLPTEYAKPGTAIELHLPEGRRQAEVVALPWFPAEKKIPTW
jgi:glycine cleavage system aminomethyltransferase T